jgi:hypothetical protein
MVSHDACPPVTGSSQNFWYHFLVPFCNIQVPSLDRKRPKETPQRTTMNEDDASSSDDDDDFLEYLLENDEDDKDDLELFRLILQHRRAARRSAARRRARRTKPRQSFFVRNRIEWESHVQKLLAEGPLAFSRMYRMDYNSFVKLCAMVEPFMERDIEKAQARWGGRFVIATEIALHCLLRYLAGGSYLDIRLSAGISVPSFYRIVHVCINAIVKCEDLSFSFPSTDDELQEIADGFRALSTKEVINGCVGCLDGLLLKVRTPSSKETGNVKSFFSGHYQTYGINVQAACDSKCRFISICIAAPGGCNDIAAFRRTPLHELVQQLPMGKYVIGDNAYCCSEHLLTPFSGKYKT